MTELPQKKAARQWAAIQFLLDQWSVTFNYSRDGVSGQPFDFAGVRTQTLCVRTPVRAGRWFLSGPILTSFTGAPDNGHIDFEVRNLWNHDDPTIERARQAARIANLQLPVPLDAGADELLQRY